MALNLRLLQLSAAMLACVLAQPLATAATDREPAIHLELNKAEQVGKACRLTLVASNRTATGLDSLAVELVLFDTAGAVALLSKASIGALPAGRTVVRQFDFADITCAELGRLLVNGVTDCEGPGMTVEACESALGVTSRPGTPQFAF